MGRGKWKPQRGGARRFTSPRDPDAYIHGNRKPTSDSEEGQDEETSTTSSEEETSGSDTEQITTKPAKGLNKDMKKLSLKNGKPQDDDSSEDESASEKEEVPVKAPVKAPSKPAAPRELTRKEREAIEKERARQHYLKMKEQEDGARLAIIRKKREEEAAQYAAEQKAKEEARFNRR